MILGRHAALKAPLLVPLWLTLAPAAALSAPLTLDDCIREALLHAPALTEARAQADSAREARVLSSARWYPSLSLGAGYDRGSSERYFDFLSQRFFQVRSESWSAGLSANQMIFGGGERYFQNRAASARERAAQSRLSQAQVQVSLETEKAFLAVHEAEEECALARERLSLSETDQRSAKLKTGAGLQSRADLASAEAAVLESRYQSRSAEAALRNAREALLLLLGRESQEDLELVPPPAPEPGLKPLSWCEDKLKTSQEALARTEDLESSREGFLASLSGWMPQVWASGRYSLWTDDLPFEKPTWSLGLSASLPLFDGGIRSSQTRSAHAELERSRASSLVKERQALSSLRAAYEAADLSEERLAVDQAQEDAAEEQYRLSRLRYQSGMAGEDWNDQAGTLTALLRTQQAWAEARLKSLRGRYERRRRRAELAAQMGMASSEIGSGAS